MLHVYNLSSWNQIDFVCWISEPQVDSVTPTEGSLCGETRLLISGRGFSQDNINEGNQVQLVSGTTSYDCPVSKDGTTELKVMCYTP